MSERIRVLVVDDSALMRKLIPTILERDPSIEVVGTAMDGAFALKKIEEFHPDVITLDLEMPRMDGMEALRLIMRRTPLPVIVFSTHSREGAYSTFKALALGAIDFVAKPKNAAAGHLDAIALQLIEKIKVAKRASGRKVRSSVLVETQPVAKKIVRATLPPNRIVAIGISVERSGGNAAGRKENRTRHASAKPNCCHWDFHRGSQRAAVRAVSNSRGLSGEHADCAAHARGFYRDVRETIG